MVGPGHENLSTHIEDHSPPYKDTKLFQKKLKQLLGLQGHLSWCLNLSTADLQCGKLLNGLSA